MRNNLFNYVLFAACSATMIGLYFYAEKNWLPKPQPVKSDIEKAKEGNALASVAGAAGEMARPALKEEAKTPPPAAKPIAPPTPAEIPTLIALGDETFFNKLLLTTRGGGVQQIVLPEFNEANRLGREAKRDGEALKLFLVPGIVRPRLPYLADEPPYPSLVPGKALTRDILAEPSYTLFHYGAGEDKFPLPDLGERKWDVVSESRPEEGPHAVVFQTKLGEPYFLTIRKTYTLEKKDYHVGLKIDFVREEGPGASKGKGVFRYQLSGPRGLPIEGEWYTPTYRNAIIGTVNPKGSFGRTFEDAATIATQRGGQALERGGNTFQYAAITTQYFASAVAVDDTATGDARNPWSYVRATTELPMESKADPKQTQFEDITIRAVSEPLDLAPGQSVTHSYLLYNGPAKVRLLKLLSGDKAVNEQLVDRYLNKLGLSTLTDYQTPTALGRFASAIYWTDLVITFTNLMHWLLAGIHWVLNGFGLSAVSWGLSIIVLTVMVRLVLFFPSRKQTQMNMKMVEAQNKLKPELEKLHEKYKDDFQTYNREKTALMLKNGVNPFSAMGGCLLLFAQMPIMMGLYFCLQESIFFRLEPLLWIVNLAAPDMTVWWGENIPMLSTPDALGGFLYLGPYFNVLPILAVALMMYQQNKMMPPPTDDMAKQQRTMMKFMLGMMALFFYKVAAGLSIYFIVSTLWGVLERKLVPKPKLKTEGGPTGDGDGPYNGGPDDAPPRPKGMVGRLRERMNDKLEELQKQAEAQSSRQLRNDPRRDNDRKKKRRKN